MLFRPDTISGRLPTLHLEYLELDKNPMRRALMLIAGRLYSALSSVAVNRGYQQTFVFPRRWHFQRRTSLRTSDIAFVPFDITGCGLSWQANSLPSKRPFL